MNRNSIDQAITDVKEDVIRWRRHLHAHPELTFHELETAKYIKEQLETLPGMEVSQLTPNSVIARLKGAKPGRHIALRADIDALPIEEESGEPFSSTIPGVMHACGHDAHTAMLLGAAKVLSQYKEDIAGEVLFIFQHAEEVPPGGAAELIDKGVLNGIDMVFGLHVWPGSPTGEIGYRNTVFCASSDNFDVTIKGKSAHGSQPQFSIDPVLIGSEVVCALQSIVSRRIDPLKAPVITVATFEAGSSYNVIPDTTHLAGTFRTHDKTIRENTPKLIEQTIAGICSIYGADYDIRWTYGYPVGINDPKAAEVAVAAIADYMPGCTAYEADAPMFGSEDFSSYLEKVPGCFMFMGTRNEKIGAVHGLHNSKFKLDEEAMQHGVQIHVGIIRETLMK